MQVEICTHYPKDLLKEDLAKAVQNYDTVKCCDDAHTKDPKLESGTPSDLWTCLHCLKNLCGRTTEGQCMIKHKDNVKGHQVVASFKKNMIWCYECDDTAQNILQQAKMFNEDYLEDQEYHAFESFFGEICGAFVDAKLTGAGVKKTEDV